MPPARMMPFMIDSPSDELYLGNNELDCSELFLNYSFPGSFLNMMCAVYLNVVFGLLFRVGGSGWVGMSAGCGLGGVVVAAGGCRNI